MNRAFHSLAALAGIEGDAFELQSVGRPVAWSDLVVRALRMLGLQRAAERASLTGLRRAWAEGAGAVRTGRQGGGLASAAAEATSRGVASAATEATSVGLASVSGSAAPVDQGEAPPLNLVYYCYGSSHSSVTAANIHLGHLPCHRRPSPFEILHQPLFDRTRSTELGLFRHMGDDEAGNAIYVLGLAGGKSVVSRALVDLLAIFGVPVNTFRFEPMLQNAGVILRIGGYASRALGWVAIGRPLSALGVWLKYRGYAADVLRVRGELIEQPSIEQPSP
jgi:hypothetical protein